MCQKHDKLTKKVDEREIAHDMSRIHEYSVKEKPCYGKKRVGVPKVNQILYALE
ncbi:hypothetical protein [Holospora curviuscula]|uniref:hypothetical protein n=1 Tax=Holospora curviuscula TaxID=1082868 RepID=UPI001A9C6FE9|nr:hypothetical protein [Holospora curviuscula]